MQKSRKNLIKYLLICFMFFIIEPVFAESCDGLLTPGAYEMLQNALDIIRIAAPALLIVLGSVDLGTAVISDDKDGLKKATSKLIKRFLAAIAIFFVPLIVNVLIDLVESSTGASIVDDPMCGLE